MSTIAELAQMGIDIYHKRIGKYTVNEQNDTYRKVLLDEFGENGKFNYLALSPEKKWNFFNLIAIQIDAIIPAVLQQDLEDFCDIRNAAWGDQLIFEVPETKLFDVLKVSQGNTNVIRQRLDKKSITLTPEFRTIKIYDELYRFLSGRVDWNLLIDRIAMSFNSQIKYEISTAIYNTYSDLSSPYAYTGTFDITQFITMAEHVQAGCGGERPICFGTKLALMKILQAANFNSLPMLEEYNRKGYLANFMGVSLMELTQAHVPNTDTFGVNTSMLIVIPTVVQKFVKLGFEGTTQAYENSGNDNVDLSREFIFMKMYDMGILASGKYGIYLLS